MQDRFDHHRSSGARSIPGRSADELGQRGTADHRAGDSLFEFLLRGELRHGHAIDRSLRKQRNHRRIAMTADHHAVHVVDVGAGGFRQVTFETGRIQGATHADNPVFGKSRSLERQISQRIHRVGDHDDDRAGRIFHHVLDHAFHNVGVGADQLLAGHARLAGNTRGDHHHVRVGSLLVVVGHADELRIEIHQRRTLVHIQHLTLRQALFDVDEDHFARHFAASHHIGASSAHGARAHNCYL